MQKTKRTARLGAAMAKARRMAAASRELVRQSNKPRLAPGPLKSTDRATR